MRFRSISLLARCLTRPGTIDSSLSVNDIGKFREQAKEAAEDGAEVKRGARNEPDSTRE
jgi:hypothetical protein